MKKIYLLFAFFLAIFINGGLFTHQAETLSSYNALFNYLPRVSLLVKEQYVEPERIDPDAMLAAIFSVLEAKIPNLVIRLPKALVEKAKTNGQVFDGDGGSLPIIETPQDGIPTTPKTVINIKEELIVELGSSKKTFDFESGRSLWGMIFFLRDVLKFIETEGDKQGLSKGASPNEPIEWDKIESAIINAMLSRLDPHSVFLEPKYARDLTTTTKGEFGGVGIVISIRDGFLTVISPMDDTPAFKVGVKAKDRIIKINDTSAINMDLNDAVSMLRGEPNTKVHITVQRENKVLEFELKRAVIKVESVAYVLLDNKVGYLRIKSFQGNTEASLIAAILDMKKKSKGEMIGLVFDTRGNPGGLLSQAVAVSKVLLDKGEIVSTKGRSRDDRQVESANKGQLDPNLKVVVLVDEGSASASEIVAGALKYNDRALVVGNTTFGKGSVQMVFELPSLNKENRVSGIGNIQEKAAPVEPAALKLTIAQYYGPNEKTIQTLGVNPDITLNEVNADKKGELRIFGHPSMREADLTAHLLGKNKQEEKSFYSIDYLKPSEDDKANEYSKLDITNLNKDFAVKVAAEIAKSSSLPSRAEMLKSAEAVVKKFSADQELVIANALKKFDIDWSKGENRATAKDILVNVVQNKPVLSGDKMHLVVKVKNISSKPIYQVHGITKAKTTLFDKREFLFGKIEPQKEVEASIEIEIPKDAISRRDFLSLEIMDAEQKKILDVPMGLEIVGLKRPIFTYAYYLDDTNRSKDGSFDMVLWLKNIGEGKAFEPTVLLRSDEADKIFIEKGRVQGGELLPGKETAMRFTFKLKEKVDSANFELQMFDGQIHDLWQDKIKVSFDALPEAQPVMTKITPKEKAIDLFDKPKGKKIATLNTGFSMNALKEIGDFYYVKTQENLAGFVAKSNVKKNDTGGVIKGAISQTLAEVYYPSSPPKVFLKFADGLGLSKTANGMLNAKIKNADALTELILYINGKKVLYKAINKPQKEQDLNYLATLKPGVNIITLMAKVNSLYGQKENMTIFFDDKNQIASSLKPKS